MAYKYETTSANDAPTISYEQLSDLPSLNGIVLKGNRNVAEHAMTAEEIDAVMGKDRKEGSHGAEL